MIKLIYKSYDNSYVYDLSNTIIESVEVKLGMFGAVGELTCSFYKGSDFGLNLKKIENGAYINLYYDQTPIFMGRIFSFTETKNSYTDVKVLDQLKYLQAEDEYYLNNITSEQVIRRLCQTVNVDISDMEINNYLVEDYYTDKKKLVDIINTVLAMQFYSLNVRYIYYDYFGKLYFKKVFPKDFVFAKGSNLSSINKTSSIEDSFTSFRLARVIKDKDTKAETLKYYTKFDKDRSQKWGILHYYEVIDEEGTSDAQMNLLLNNLYNEKSKETQKVDITAINNYKKMIHAGDVVFVDIETDENDKINLKPYFVGEINHSFKGSSWDMNISLIGRLD